MHSTLQPKGSRLAPQQAAARLRRRGRSACTPAAQAVESAQAEAAFFKPTNGGGGGARALGVEVDVPRLGYVGEGVPSPFCTFQACPLPSPNSGPRTTVDKHNAFVSDEDRVLLKSISYGDSSSAGAEDCNADCNFDPRWCVRAGPRASLFFRPSDVRAAVVTCGGLCPGLNDVIRQLVLTLESGYGVSDIVGVQYGFRGFFEEGLPMLKLTKKTVNNIHLEGGSVLGTSRGGGDVVKIVDSIIKRGINQLYVLGGNGTHAGGAAIYAECVRRKYVCAVVGVPKTIDNDILLIDKTFGFDTAVEEAQRALRAASIEAKSAYRGVGVVKLMGRQSGFITMYASIASGEVDVTLIPEVPFTMEGRTGVMEHLRYLLEAQGHAIVCLAEGAGQEFVPSSGTDASGNPILGDVGPWFCKQVKTALHADVKYIDPTYMVRGCTANAHDKVYCNILGQNAAHAAMAGFTGCSVGLVNTHYVYLPIPMLIEKPRYVDPSSRMYSRLLASTGQPDFSPTAAR